MANLMLNIVAYQEKELRSGTLVFSVAFLSQNGTLAKGTFQNVYGSENMMSCGCKKVADIDVFIQEHNAPFEKRLKKIALLKEYGYHNAESKSIGDGQWSLEVYGWNKEEDRKEFLFELVGSNGTRDEESDDLHGYLSELYDEAFPPEERESVVDRG
jgi:hypothetical protein